MITLKIVRSLFYKTCVDKYDKGEKILSDLSFNNLKSRLKYSELNTETEKKIKKNRENNWVSEFRFNDDNAIRRRKNRDNPNIWRTAFVRDIDKILHLPLYNRYSDKTQVFSFYHNDDLTRRSLHVQLVSRIARNIGSVLGLNIDLIEAIALGHDIGHTPFGHAGERYLNEILKEETGKCFNHNVQSVRVLDKIYGVNVTLQTLDGILCHNGEFEMKEYRPSFDLSFDSFDKTIEECLNDGEKRIKKLVPSTLEGCVVRISDMIAYLGKDRQDARIAKIIDGETKFSTDLLGNENAAIINNLTVDLIENSYGKDYIMLSEPIFLQLKQAKRENNELIYKSPVVMEKYDKLIKPMFEDMYFSLLKDIEEQNEGSEIYRHYLKYVGERNVFYEFEYKEDDKNQIVVDFIASMTDDYFIDLHEKLFPNSKFKINYESYFKD